MRPNSITYLRNKPYALLVHVEIDVLGILSEHANWETLLLRETLSFIDLKEILVIRFRIKCLGIIILIDRLPLWGRELIFFRLFRTSHPSNP